MKQDVRRRLSIYLRLSVFAVLLAGVLWCGYSVAQYLHSAPRFEVQKLSVTGLNRGGENQVLAMAGFQLGNNVFEADLEAIRQSVEQLQWVRHALVQRVLPDQIIIKVVEREPVGIARIHDEIFQFDIDAVILNLDAAGSPSFPILDGLKPGSEKNPQKVWTYLQVLDQLGQTELSEVHVNDAGEVSVVSASDPLLINLGASEFRSRWIKYLQLKTQIQERYPNAVRVDLRFQNQVIVSMRDEEDGENIGWDEERRIL
jgi:cell division septal protein FtsQ